MEFPEKKLEVIFKVSLEENGTFMLCVVFYSVNFH